MEIDEVAVLLLIIGIIVFFGIFLYCVYKIIKLIRNRRNMTL